MDQFEPCAGKGFIKGLRIVEEATGNLAEFRVEAQRQVGYQHGRLAFSPDRTDRGSGPGIFGFKLNGASRAAGLDPFVFEQVLEEVVAPLGRGLCPDHFQT